jgi:Ohr subfamily peroxiredoxin
MDVLYTAEATSSGGREGRVRTSDGVIDLALSMPKELGGLGKPGTTNPEELFAAGYAACFENALLRAARERQVRPDGASVTARVGIGRMENGRFGLKVDLLVAVAGVARAEAEELARAAHEEICPYSRATRGNIDVTVAVT